MEERCTLEQLCAAAARSLKNGGRFALVHRADRLTDLLCALRGAGLEPKRMQLVQHREGKAPSAVLLPPLVKRLREAGREVRFIIGSGKVGPLNEDEIRVKLGDEVYEMHLPVTSNDVSKPENYTFMGITTRGIPLWVHNWVAQADVKLTVGTTPQLPAINSRRAALSSSTPPSSLHT